jgi:trehalose synthase-fused probable maltokinase
VSAPGRPASVPVVHVAGAASEALAPGALATLDGEPLARFLADRRWFGGKGSPPRGARVAHVIPLDLAPPASPAVLAVVEVAGDDGRVARYQLPLTVREVGGDNGGGGPGAVLARVESAGGRGSLLFDATEDRGFREALGALFARGASFGAAKGTARWVVEPLAGDAGTSGPLGDARLLAAEQSNTSLVYGDRAILKLFRRVEPGEHPDVEIGRFLAASTAFRNTPALLGVLRLAISGETEAVAGMLQRFVPGSRDGWAHALGRAAEFFAGREPAGRFADDARELGRVTRALHEALAAGTGEAFAPLPVAATDVARWAAATRRAMSEALALLAARADGLGLAEPARREAAAVLAARGELAARVDRAAALLEGHAGMRIRHHGDYHLGQVLRAPDGTFFIIDFEGEPARSLAERRERHSPLRDVAGMVRSFSYAAAVGAVEAGQGPGADAARWEDAARAAFLTAYFAEPDGAPAPFLPDTPGAAHALLALFELEKLFYELAYELNNRPAWTWVPLGAVARLLQTDPARD